MLDELRTRADQVVDVSSKQGAPTTTLAALQYMLRHDEVSTALSADGTVVVHETFGEARQVDVLRDELLHQLAHDDGASALDESEILVVCPDLARFGPLLASGLGPRRGFSSRSDEPALAYRMVDATTTEEGLYVGALRRLMALLKSRCSRRDVLRFLAEPAVARARELSDEQLSLIDAWTTQCAVRWGLNATHRSRFDMGVLGDVNTWEFALRRLHLGLFVENRDVRAVAGVVPVECALGDLETVAALTRVVADLTADAAATFESRTLGEWLAFTDEVARRWIEPGPDDTYDLERATRSLQRYRDAADFTAEPISFVDFVAVLDDILASSGSPSAVLTGWCDHHVTRNLEGVSFRSVILIGFDDDAFTAVDSDRLDVRRHDPAPGDVTAYDTARGTLRELILAARERLTIIRSGRDDVTGLPRERGTAVSEFDDALEAVLAPGEKVCRLAHPRHAFSPENFEVGEDNFATPLRRLGLVLGPWSHSALHLRAASTEALEAWAQWREIDDREPAIVDDLSLADLEKFLKNAPALFVERTLGITFPRATPEEFDDVDIAVTALRRSSLLTTLWRYVRSRSQRCDDDELLGALEALAHSGDIAPPSFFAPSAVLNEVRAFDDAFNASRQLGRPTFVTVDLDCASSRVSGQLEVVVEDSSVRLVEVVISRPSLRGLLGPWLRALAARASLSGPLTFTLIHRVVNDRDDRGVVVSNFVLGTTQEEAREALADVVRFYRDNVAHPVPLDVVSDLAHFVTPRVNDLGWSQPNPSARRPRFFSTTPLGPWSLDISAPTT
jgi:exodeoxyribonuclease V gamma subunit